ncbi:MAG: AEC family transporter, partial [Spirochaetaceae bacterium]|nr:AEC family transporter [Spirochaetaceae bacterium]
DYFLPVFYVVLQLLIIMGIGFVVRRSGRWADNFFQGLSRLVVRVALPFYFIVRVSRTDLSQIRTMLLMPVSAVIVVGIGFVLSLILFAVLPFRGSDRRAGIAMATFGNSGYLPLAIAEIVPLSVPLVGERFGLEFPPILIAAYLFVQSPLLWSVGRYVITKTDANRSGIRLRDLLSPPLVGILIGLAVALSGLGKMLGNPVLPVAPVFAALERLAAITLPLALLNLGGLIGGVKVTRDDLRSLLGMTGAVALVRLILLPGLFYAAFFGVLRHLSLAPAVLFVLFLEAHTPPATNLSIMAGEAGVNEHHTAVTLLGNYVLYLLLMPVYLAVFLFITR